MKMTCLCQVFPTVLASTDDWCVSCCRTPSVIIVTVTNLSGQNWSSGEILSGRGWGNDWKMEDIPLVSFSLVLSLERGNFNCGWPRKWGRVWCSVLHASCLESLLPITAFLHQPSSHILKERSVAYHHCFPPIHMDMSSRTVLPP